MSSITIVLSFTGSHIYIDAGEGLVDEASLTAVITEAATWKIKVVMVHLMT